jgi:hypothetical protein
MTLENKSIDFLEKNKELPNKMLPLDNNYSSSVSTLNTWVAVSFNPKLALRCIWERRDLTVYSREELNSLEDL